MSSVDPRCNKLSVMHIGTIHHICKRHAFQYASSIPSLVTWSILTPKTQDFQEGVGHVEVLSIEPLSSPGRGLLINEYFVKRAYKRNGLPFVVKSYEQWGSPPTPPAWL